jgi:hypothetical protein
MDPRIIVLRGVDCVLLDQTKPLFGCCEYGNENLCSIKDGVFPDWLGDN